MIASHQHGMSQLLGYSSVHTPNFTSLQCVKHADCRVFNLVCEWVQDCSMTARYDHAFKWLYFPVIENKTNRTFNSII